MVLNEKPSSWVKVVCEGNGLNFLNGRFPADHQIVPNPAASDTGRISDRLILFSLFLFFARRPRLRVSLKSVLSITLQTGAERWVKQIGLVTRFRRTPTQLHVHTYTCTLVHAYACVYTSAASAYWRVVLITAKRAAFVRRVSYSEILFQVENFEHATTTAAVVVVVSDDHVASAVEQPTPPAPSPPQPPPPLPPPLLLSRSAVVMHAPCGHAATTTSCWPL